MIYQINVFVCELCHEVSVRVSEQAVYSDPLITFPEEEGWEYIEVEGRGKVMACGACAKTKPRATVKQIEAQQFRAMSELVKRGVLDRETVINYARNSLGIAKMTALEEAMGKSE